MPRTRSARCASTPRSPTCSFGCCYKFLLGVHGVAIASWNRRRLPDWRPRLTGWHSTEWRPPLEEPRELHVKSTGQAFEPGNPAYPALYVLEASLDYLAALGMERIEAHTLAMSAALRRRLVALGLPVMTPEPAAARAASIAFEQRDPMAVREALEAERVLVTGELGRVRASVGIFNTAADIDEAARAIGTALRASA